MIYRFFVAAAVASLVCCTTQGVKYRGKKDILKKVVPLLKAPNSTWFSPLPDGFCSHCSGIQKVYDIKTGRLLLRRTAGQRSDTAIEVRIENFVKKKKYNVQCAFSTSEALCRFFYYSPHIFYILSKWYIYLVQCIERQQRNASW